LIYLPLAEFDTRASAALKRCKPFFAQLLALEGFVGSFLVVFPDEVAKTAQGVTVIEVKPRGLIRAAKEVTAVEIPRSLGKALSTALARPPVTLSDQLGKLRITVLYGHAYIVAKEKPP